MTQGEGESMTGDLHLCASDVARYVVGKCSNDLQSF